jgi:hypothetical protein
MLASTRGCGPTCLPDGFFFGFALGIPVAMTLRMLTVDGPHPTVDVRSGG